MDVNKKGVNQKLYSCKEKRLQYTRLDKIRSEVIRKELEISGIKDVRAKHKQNGIIHIERMDNTRLPKHVLNYKPRGRRDRGRPRQRWQRVDAGTGQSTKPMEEDDDGGKINK